MKEQNINKRNILISKFFDWIIHISCYSLSLFIVDILFNAFEVDNFIYYFVASIIISILNKTIKPILFKLTIPLTGLTFGLFYFVIDFIILEIVDIILGKHFDIYGIFWGIFIAFILAIISFLIDEIIGKNIIRSCDK